MKLTLSLKVDNADETDVKAFTFLLQHLTAGTDGVARLMRKGRLTFKASTPGKDAEGRDSFKTGRTITVQATREGR